jgi:phosphopantothenoylcysteine synthetase/decarboxylase
MGDPEENARRKLRGHGLDLIVGNDVSGEDSGFAGDKNRAVLVFRGGRVQRLPLMTKLELAGTVLDAAEPLLPSRKARTRHGKPKGR